MLEDYPREVVLKDGTAVILRPLVPEDETRMREFIERIPEAERWFLREEIHESTKLHEWLQKLDLKRTVPLVAVKPDDQRIIGNVRLHRRPSQCLRHVAHLRIMVDPEFRHLRLGTWMLVDTIKLAMGMGIEKLVAEFVSGIEDQARTAIQRLDFFEHAVLKDYVKDPHGNYRDLYILVKTIHREWSDF